MLHLMDTNRNTKKNTNYGNYYGRTKKKPIKKTKENQRWQLSGKNGKINYQMISQYHITKL